MTPSLYPFSFDRVVQAVELVKERLFRAAGALERDGIEYAVAGGNAVASWVSRVDRDAARSTVDVDLLVRRSDLGAIKQSLESVGFVYCRAGGLDMFLDGPDGKARTGVHLIFAGEKVKEHEAFTNPDVSESEVAEDAYRVISLRALAQIKLTAFRDKDRTHLRDLLELGLLDKTWLDKLPPELAQRLQLLIDNPE